MNDFNNDYLLPIIDRLNFENKQIMLVGDFNVDLLKIDSLNDSRDFYNTLTSNLFTPFILQPTRLASKSLIDNIFFNSLEYQSYSGNLLIEISDHLIQFLILEGFIKEKSVPKLNLYKRDFSNFNENEFNETILNLDWDDIVKLHNNDPNFSFNKFYNTITYHLDEFAPFKKITKKEHKLKSKPWISNVILNHIQDRDRLFKLFIKEIDPVLKELAHSNYKRIRNQVTQLKRESKTLYFTAFFEANCNKTSEIWKGIRTLVNIKSSYNSKINLLDENNNIVNEPKVIANKFNNYFTNIGPNIEKKIPNANGNYRDFLNKVNTIGKSFYLSPTTSQEIDKLIDSLDVNKSSGPNSIPVFILKIMKPFFSKWLSILINLSYRVSTFPDLLKVAKVTPIHKKDCKLKHTNYRPISLLSVISKIYEKTLYVRMYSYLSNNNLLYDKQFGFRSSYSTIHALTDITENIKILLDSQFYVCGIFVDLEKAFDTVNHKILIDKLNVYGFRGQTNLLLKSYLYNRKQFVSINGFDSNINTIKCGVPQGSCLGPLLFLIYINDFRYCLNKTNTGHFADDTYIMFSSKKIKTIETVINHELKMVSNWMNLNKLSLNTDKTKLIIFRSKQKPFDSNMLSIKLNGKKLKLEENVKYLGMYLDQHLTWEYHINQLSKKLSRANGIISKLRHNAPIKTCLQVYYAIFYSHLIYGSSIWGLTYEKNLESIRLIQKKCIRLLTFSEFRCPTNKLFCDLQLLKVDDIIKIQQLKLIFEFKNNMLPSELNKLFKLTNQNHNYETSSSFKNFLFIPQINTVSYGSKSIKYRGPYLWNDTCNNNPSLNEVQSTIQLKKNLKNYFLSRYDINT